MSKYAIGIDFGTESGRALLVDVADGREVATEVHTYANGVIDEKLPGSDVRLDPDWALQDPNDYIETFKQTIPAVLKESGVDPADVIGLGIDFTACTMMPIKADGTPLCLLPKFHANPHAWVKLWKHHAAQPEANKINATAREMSQAWLDRYGGKISSEWFFSKTLQILDEAPEIYEAADRLIEAADWVVWQLTGEETRNSCTAGYKAMWSKREGFPSDEFFKALDPRLEHVIDEKMSREDHPHRRPGGRPDPSGGCLDGAQAGHGGGDRQRGCACSGAGGDGDRAGTHGDDHGHSHLPHGAGQRGAPGAGYVRLCGGRHHPRVLWLRGRAVVRGRPLRLVRGELRAGRLRRRGTNARPGYPPAAGGEGSGVEAGRKRPAGAGLVERQPQRAGGRGPDRPAAGSHAGDQGRGDLPRLDRGHCLRHARHHRGLRDATACR